jgi:hypothetical protein
MPGSPVVGQADLATRVIAARGREAPLPWPGRTWDKTMGGKVKAVRRGA